MLYWLALSPGLLFFPFGSEGGELNLDARGDEGIWWDGSARVVDFVSVWVKGGAEGMTWTF